MSLIKNLFKKIFKPKIDSLNTSLMTTAQVISYGKYPYYQQINLTQIELVHLYSRLPSRLRTDENFQLVLSSYTEDNSEETRKYFRSQLTLIEQELYFP